MAQNNFMEYIRSFFGFRTNPPRNDFRNPIWSSDDEDDGDELYNTRQQIEIFDDAADIHREIKKQMQDVFKSFGSMFGEFTSLFHDDHIDAFTSMCIPENPDSENMSSNNIRDYYLKPGYQNRGHEHPKEDLDLDGKITSNEISGLLKHKKDSHNSGIITPFNGNLVPGRSFCQTIITTSITKPDGTVETRRIVKKGNEVVDETVTSSGTPVDSQGPNTPGLDLISSPGFIYKQFMSELSSFLRNYH